MASSLVLKVSLGIGGVAAATGVAIGIPKLMSEKEQLISEIIKTKDPKRRLITATSLDDVSWKKAWESYRKVNKDAIKGKDAFELPDWTGPITGNIVADNSAVQGLLNACNSNSQKKTIYGSQLYKDVLSYCTRNTTLSDVIKESGKTILLISEAATSSNWKGAWERYRLANKDKNEDAWKLTGFSGKKDQASQQAWDVFRTQCDSNLKSDDISNTNFLDQVKDWCTVEGK